MSSTEIRYFTVAVDRTALASAIWYSDGSGARLSVPMTDLPEQYEIIGAQLDREFVVFSMSRKAAKGPA